MQSALARLRASSWVDRIGLALVGLVVVWLIVNFIKDPVEFVNVGIIGLTNGAIYGVVALGYTLVYGILQLINFAHGDVFALSGLFASTIIVSVLGPANIDVVQARIDTGSDETLFPEDVAARIGLDLANAPAESFGGQGGGQLTARFAHVSLRLTDGIEFREWPAWVGFVATGLRWPVLGFGGFLQFFDSTFRGADETVELVANRLCPGT